MAKTLGPAGTQEAIGETSSVPLHCVLCFPASPFIRVVSFTCFTCSRTLHSCIVHFNVPQFTERPRARMAHTSLFSANGNIHRCYLNLAVLNFHFVPKVCAFFPMLSTMSTELWCNPAECSFQSRKFDERGGNTSHTRSRKKESLPTLWEDAVLLTDSEILWLQSGVVDPRRRFTKKQHKCTVAPWQARRRELRLARRFAKTFVPEANKIPSRQCHVSGVSGVLRGTLRSSPPLRQVSTHCVPTPVSNEKGHSHFAASHRSECKCFC